MTTPATSAKPRASRFRLPIIWVLLLGIFAIAWLLVSLFGRGDFVSANNLGNILERATALGIVAIGQTFAILVASIDLSVAYLISVAAVMASFIMQGDPAKVPLAILVVLGIGAVVGAINGLLITKARINPLIATLGVGLILRGVLNASFQNFTGSVPASFQFLAYGSVGPIPVPVIILAGLTLISALLLARTRFGAHIYAVGGNRITARLSGIRDHRVVIGAHVITSITAVITGLYLSSRLRSGAPWIGTDGVYDLESIAAVVVGGTVLAGGRGGVLGTVAGVLIFAVLDTMFNQLGVNSYLKQVLRGLIIIGAVAIYAARSREVVG
ncbi:MAG TPA: ABC transporter permease [Trueperaceae bacterium]|nr:ABC transporter permease [Trueperaceae bacterium]